MKIHYTPYKFTLFYAIVITLLTWQCGICYAQKNISKSLDSLFTVYVDSSFSGAVLVAEKGVITLKKGYGYANNETREINKPNTLFNTASIGKQFTVYAVLLLEKRGLLHTSDYITKYIGAFNDVRDSATIHHLLIHSSGLFKQDATLDYATREKFIHSVKNGVFESKPGEQYRYSNAGYSMLAAIVELISGEPFEKFILKNIFEPCQMSNTGYPWEERMNKQLFATGYNSKGEPIAPQEDIWAARGPGNLVTNIEDLHKWMKMIQNDKFMPPDVESKILKDYLPDRDTYSWNKSITTRRTKFYHKGGGRADFESRLMWYPDDDVIIIFCINNDYNLARRLFSTIRNLMD